MTCGQAGEQVPWAWSVSGDDMVAPMANPEQARASGSGMENLVDLLGFKEPLCAPPATPANPLLAYPNRAVVTEPCRQLRLGTMARTNEMRKFDL